jgi:hypothetical protein
MFTFDALLEAREHGRRLRAEADLERLVRRGTARRAVADALRRAADRLDPFVSVPVPKPR